MPLSIIFVVDTSLFILNIDTDEREEVVSILEVFCLHFNHILEWPARLQVVESDMNYFPLDLTCVMRMSIDRRPTAAPVCSSVLTDLLIVISRF